MRLDGDSVVPGLSIRPDRYTQRLWEANPHCIYCGRGFSNHYKATLDHVIPQCQGGENVTENVVLCCKDCNQAKGDRTLEQWIAALEAVRRSRESPEDQT